MSDPVIAADYRASEITGHRWRRANRVVINNPVGGPATMSIDEEEVTQVGDLLSAEPTDLLHMTVDLTGTVPIYNPQTGQATGGSMTQLDVYVALYSVYRQLAAARDAAEAAAAAAAAALAAQLAQP